MSLRLHPFKNPLPNLQRIFLFQLTITDPSYNAYFRMINTQADSFQVKMLSQTLTPHQVYRFAGPDPATTEHSNTSDISTNTIYNIAISMRDLLLSIFSNKNTTILVLFMVLVETKTFLKDIAFRWLAELHNAICVPDPMLV